MNFDNDGIAQDETFLKDYLDFISSFFVTQITL